MSSDLSDNHFQVIIFGTGLAESICAAALAKAGFTVAHLDPNQYYGAEQASLTIDELREWANHHTNGSTGLYSSISSSSNIIPQSRQYAVSLSPAVIRAVGPLISTLVASGVSRYGGYKLLDRIGIYDSSGSVRVVPGSKDAVFKSKDLSLIDKRRLMRFLMFAADDFENKPELEGKQQMPFLEYLRTTFSLPQPISEAVAYAIAFCGKAADPTLPALQRVRSSLRSTGRYGPSPFLVGHYGGSGEIAQGFCRTAAVHGGVYILGRPVVNVESQMSANLPGSFTVDIEGFPEKLTSNLLISSPTLLPETLREAARKVSIASEDSIKQESIVRGILIMDHAIVFEALETEQNDYEEEQEIDEDSSPSPTRPTDTAVLIFPPSSFDGCRDDAAVTVFIAGEGSMSTPRGKWIAYLSLPLSLTGDTVSAEGVLKPYVNKLISLCAPPNGATSVTEPLFSTYYIQKHQESHLSQFDESSLVGTQPSPVLVTPPVPTSLTDSSDITVTAGEALFWAAVKSLKARGIIPRNTEGRQNDVIDSVWPPLDSTGDDDD